MTRIPLKMSFIDPYLALGDKMKNLKPYCAYTRHTKRDPRVSFLKSLKCRRNSSDKLFFRTYGRTERGNNNIPELSLEIAGIIKDLHIQNLLESLNKGDSTLLNCCSKRRLDAVIKTVIPARKCLPLSIKHPVT